MKICSNPVKPSYTAFNFTSFDVFWLSFIKFCDIKFCSSFDSLPHFSSPPLYVVHLSNFHRAFLFSAPLTLPPHSITYVCFCPFAIVRSY